MFKIGDKVVQFKASYVDQFDTGDQVMTISFINPTSNAIRFKEKNQQTYDASRYKLVKPTKTSEDKLNDILECITKKVSDMVKNNNVSSEYYFLKDMLKTHFNVGVEIRTSRTTIAEFVKI